MIQWNPIGIILLYFCQYLLRNISDSSLILLAPRCILSFTYSEVLLWLQSSTLTCQDFHRIVFLLRRHPCVVSLDLLSMGHPLERSDCWLYFSSLSKLISAKPFWHLLVILWLMKISWVVEWNVTLLSLNLLK